MFEPFTEQALVGADELTVYTGNAELACEAHGPGMCLEVRHDIEELRDGGLVLQRAQRPLGEPSHEARFARAHQCGDGLEPLQCLRFSSACRRIFGAFENDAIGHPQAAELLVGDLAEDDGVSGPALRFARSLQPRGALAKLRVTVEPVASGRLGEGQSVGEERFRAQPRAQDASAGPQPAGSFPYLVGRDHAEAARNSCLRTRYSSIVRFWIIESAPPALCAKCTAAM